MATQHLIHVTTSTQYRRHHRDQRERRPRLWLTPHRVFWFLAASPPPMRQLGTFTWSAAMQKYTARPTVPPGP